MPAQALNVLEITSPVVEKDLFSHFDVFVRHHGYFRNPVRHFGRHQAVFIAIVVDEPLKSVYCVSVTFNATCL